MGLINRFMDIVAPPFLLIALFFFLPPFYLYKLINSFLSSRFPEDMANKVVLIVGASSGIGEHLAYKYAKRGAFLVLVARRKKSLQDVARMCRDFGSPSVLAVPADFTNPEECQKFVNATIKSFGRLDHLVNVAGVAALPLFEEIAEPSHFQAVMDVNFWGPVYTTYFAIPHLKKSRGRIVGVTSVSAYTNIPRMTIYNASVGIVPIERTRDFARSVVERVCNGASCVIEPPWYLGLYYFRAFIPEVTEWGMRLFYVTPPGVPATEDLAKKLMDLPFVKYILYPPPVRSPEIKRD
ncbi:11-beta-hydroxysteroid dehydrogenase A-like isoform X2 [Carex rostrata]